MRAALIGTAAALAAAAALPHAAPAAGEQTQYGAWGRGTLSDAQLTALIGQMTLAEEVGMLHGGTDADCGASAVGCVGQAGYIPGVARLGVPALRLTDGPAGVRLSHPETALPAPVGLAATFDRGAAEDFGAVEGREGRATNQDVLLAPMINQVNFVTGGRNFETTGEDPYLAGQLATPLVRGIQGQGLIATLKHYVENDFENSRQQTSVAIDERTLHETELQAFEAAMAADPGSVMCSYNRVNDVYACSNDELQNGVLRGRLGFEGFVMSDWGATHRLSDLINGLDLQMPSGSIFSLANLTDATTNGTAAIAQTNDLPAVPAYGADRWKSAVDTGVLHILSAMNKAGLLEGTQYGSHSSHGGPYVPPRPDLDALKTSDFAVARDVAEKSATLLKNDNNALPLGADAFGGRGTVLMGPTAQAPYIGGGGSAHVTPFPSVTGPYDALAAHAGGGSSLSWVPGYDLDGELMPATPVTAPAGMGHDGEHGWIRQQITTASVPSGSAPTPQAGGAADRLDPTVDYRGAGALPANTAWRWQSTFTAPSSGAWQLKVMVRNQSSAQLFVDGLTTAERRISLGAFGLTGGFGGSTYPTWDGLDQASKSHDPALGKLQQGTYSVTFAAGESHTLDLRAYANATDPLTVRFHWVRPDWQADKINEAVQAASFAKTAVVFAYDEGTEGADRGGSDQAAGMKLPGYQDDLISAVADANPNTIVVLNTGDPVLMPWAGKVKAILEMWYPGQQGGEATADVLTGAANPGGRLPVTFPASAAQTPTASASCTDTGINGNCPLYPGVATAGFLSGPHGYRTITALDGASGNGIFQGYRWYDRQGVAPLFPFGHGLSYTRFDYSDLNVTRGADTMTVAFTVRNAGPRAGAEVPQVYVGAPDGPPVPMAQRSLAGFERVELAPGESRRLTVAVSRRSLSYWSVQTHDWALPSGARPVYVGASSRDIRLQDDGAPQAGPGAGPGSGGGSGAGTTPPPAPKPKAVGRVVLGKGSLKVSRKRQVSIRLRCGVTAAGRCRGTLSLVTGGVTSRRTYSIAADRTVTVHLTLAKRTSARVRRLRRVKATIKVTTRGSDRVVRRASATVTLVA